MAVFRVERNTGYTVMSNHHLRNRELSLRFLNCILHRLRRNADWILERILIYLNLRM